MLLKELHGTHGKLKNTWATVKINESLTEGNARCRWADEAKKFYCTSKPFGPLKLFTSHEMQVIAICCI